jgi:hypothetical protein
MKYVSYIQSKLSDLEVFSPNLDSLQLLLWDQCTVDAVVSNWIFDSFKNLVSEVI